MLAAFAALVLLAAPDKVPAPPSGPNPFVAQAKDLYAKLEFEKCLKRIAQASQWRSSPKELLEIELYAGLCHFNLGQKADAEERFKQAVRIDPSAELPPYTSPRAVELFAKLKKTMKPKVEPPPKPPEDIPGLVEAPPEAKGDARPEPKAEARTEQRAEPRVEPRPDAAERPERKDARAEAAEPRPERKEPQRKETRGERQDPELADEPTEPGETERRSDAPTARKLTPSETADGAAQEAVARPPQPGFLVQKAPAIALTGLAAAGLGVGIGFGVATNNLVSRARGAEFESDYFALKAQAETHAVVANVSYGVAATAAIVATVLWLTGN